MTKNRSLAEKLYGGIKDKKKISVDFLYNAICYFEMKPKKVVKMLNECPKDECSSLDKAFFDIRAEVKEMLAGILSKGEFSEPFHDPEVEDILFYQMAHGYPVC